MGIKQRLAALSLTLLIALASVGCGGGGAGPRTSPDDLQTRAAFKLSISWPERTRAIEGIGSADVATLEAAEGNDLASVTANRPAGPSAQTVEYTATSTLKTGKVAVRARFYAAPGAGLGPLVGRADFEAKLLVDGTLTKVNGDPLPPIHLIKTIQSVQVAEGQEVRVGQTLDLVATAFDENESIIAVHPGAISFQVTSGQEFLTVTPGGAATGIAAGTATVVAMIDGVASQPMSVTVFQPVEPVIQVLDVQTTDIIYDSGRGLVWAATINPSIWGASLLPINVNTGALGTPISLPAEPTQLVISDNGQYLYAALANGTVQRINAETRTFDISFSPGGGIYDLAAVPGQPNSVLVSLGSTTVVYDNAVPRPNTLDLGHSVVFGADASTVFGFQRFQFGNAFVRRATLDAQGFTLVNESTTAISGYGNRIHYGDNRVFGDDGTILNADTFAKIGEFGPFSEDRVMTPLPGTGKAVFIAWHPKVLRFFDIATQAEFEPVEMGPLDGGCEDIHPAGPGRVVFRTFGFNEKVVIVSNLDY